MDSRPPNLLAVLAPSQRHTVMDLVSQAGIDVKSWAFKSDGTPVKEPRANPAYCYEWAFGNDAEGYVLCIWHESLKEVSQPQGDAIVFDENVRQLALSLDRLAIDRTQPRDVRNRSRDQAARARKFESALQRSYRKGQAVRVIVNEGDQRADDELGMSRSTVRLRELDDANWYVHRYDDATGETLLVRSIVPVAHPAETVDSLAAPPAPSVQPSVESPAAGSSEPATPSVYVDQFSEPESAALREAIVLVRARSAAVRERVLLRAQGRCELCERAGFLTTAGAIYLETHHVIPLANDGPDHENNVVALCPEDHRRAHYGVEREALADRLSALLDEVAACEAVPPKLSR